MSYIATRLNGFLKARQMVRHAAIVRYSRVGCRADSNKTAVHFRPCIALIPNRQFSQAAWASPAIAASSERRVVDYQRRIGKILKKLSSNKVSLQFDDLNNIRPNLFRNYSIAVEDGFEIMKSCSQLVDHGREQRIQLVRECWDELISMIKTPTKNQLMLLLRAYRRAGLETIEDYQTFFDRYNCTIDADIFAELMYIVCQNNDGNMELADGLLKEMIARSIEPTERIYNAMVLGYTKQGIEAVENVLEIMRSKEMPPSPDTNIELIKAYLINKRIDKALETLARSSEYTSDQLYDLIRCASIEGNEVIVEKAINLLPDTIRNAKLIAPQLQNICTELVYLNEQRPADAKLDPYQMIIRHLPVPVANILQFCNNLIEDNRNFYAIHNCCMYSMVFKLASSHDFLQSLSAKEPLRPHYFWPLLIRCTNQSEVVEVLKFATELNVIMDSMTLLDYVLPRTNTKVDAQDAVTALTSAGVRMLELKSAMISFLLNMNHSKEAWDIAHRSTSTIDPDIVAPAICRFIRTKSYHRNASTVANLIRKLQTRIGHKKSDLAGQIALSFCASHNRSSNFDTATKLLTDYERVGVRISSTAADSILDHIRRIRSVYEHLSPIIERLVDETKVAIPVTNTLESSSPTKDIEKLEKQLAEFRASNLPTHGILYRLLLKHIQLGQYDQALDVKAQCDQIGVNETPAVQSALIKLWTAKEDVDKALDTYCTLRKHHPNFDLDAYKSIDLATLLVKKSRMDEAKQLIAKLARFGAKPKQNIANLSSNVWHLLNSVSQYTVEKSIDANICEEFFELLMEKGYADRSNRLLGVVIKDHLDKKKIHEAVAAFKHNATEYTKTPQSLSLLTKLIEISNDENCLEYSIDKQAAVDYIQQIIETLKTVHGIENANVSVLLAFASAGKEEQLRKILMNPLVKFNSDILLKSLNYLKDRAKIEVVVALTRSARGLHHECLAEERLYEILLSDFVQRNDFEAALQLYEQIKSYDSASVITRKFNKTLADLLKQNNQSVPETLRVEAY